MLFLALVFTALAADPVLQADRLIWEDQRITGEGNACLTVGDDRVWGQSFTVDLVSQTATIIEGVWEQGELGQLTFEKAEVHFQDMTGTVFVGRFKGANDRLVISGEKLEIHQDNTLTGEKISLACDCDGLSPFRVTARHVTVVLDDKLTFTGGLVRILDVPAIPLPKGVVPLARRSGLLAPNLGFGADGFQVAQPLYLATSRSTDFTITPELRLRRSVRLLTEGRYALSSGKGEAHAALGYDWVTTSWRGAAQYNTALEHNSRIAAVDLNMPGDSQYLQDYGDSYVQRSTRWTNSRLLLETGPFELDSSLFLHGGPTTQRLAGAALLLPLADLGRGFLGTARFRTQILALGTSPWESSAPILSTTGEGSIGRPSTIGPLLIEPGMELQSVLVNAKQPSIFARATPYITARLLAWRTTKGLERLEPMVHLQGSLSSGQGEFSRWELGPHLRYRRVGPQGHLGALLVGATLNEHGPRARLDGRLQIDNLSAWVQLASAFERSWLKTGSVGLSWNDRPWLLEAAWLYADEDVLLQPSPEEELSLHQARATLGLSFWSVVQVTTSATVDTEGGVLNSSLLSLTYTHPSRCVALGVGARLDRDRTDGFLTIELLP